MGCYLKDSGLEKTDFDKLMEEDLAQLRIWGEQNHSAFEWLAFVTEELGELSQAISEYHFRGGDPSKVVTEAIQVSTLALKMAVMAERQL